MPQNDNTSYIKSNNNQFPNGLNNQSIFTTKSNYIFLDDFEFTTNLENNGYQVDNTADPDMIAGTNTSAAYHGTRGLYMKSNPIGSVKIIRILDIPYITNLTLSFFINTFGASGTFRLWFTSTNGEQFAIDYGQDFLYTLWEATPIFNIGIVYPIDEWYYLERNLDLDIEEALNHPQSPFETFIPNRISSFQIFQDSSRGLNHINYIDDIKIHDPLNRSISTRAPIVIHSDSEFSLSGLPGSGIKGDPYRIENYNFSGSFDFITIRDTTSHFFISNCMFDGLTISSRSIHLENVINGTIIDNTFINNVYDAIRIDNSENNSIINNSIFNNYAAGIGLYNSRNNNIINNIIYNNNNDGIRLQSSINNNIVNNIAYNNGWKGIRLESNSDNNMILNNEFYHNNEDEIWIGYYSFNNIIYNNKVHNSLGNGIWIEEFSINNILVNNDIFNNFNGIGIMNSNQNIVFNNSIHNNQEHGVWIYYSNEEFVISNLIQNNVLQGIRADNSNNLSITNNNLHENGEFAAIKFFEIINSSIINNNISEGFYQGILLEGSINNTILGNNIFNNQEYGLTFNQEGNQGNIVELNNFIKNNQDGLSQAQDAVDRNNTFRNNYWDEWTYPDNNNDSIVDIPYLIDGNLSNFDYTPQVNKFINKHELSSFQILNPNNNEFIFETVNIIWTPVVDSYGHDIVYQLLFSVDYGKTWIEIANTEDNFYMLDVTLFSAREHLIKIRAYDAENLTIEAISINIKIIKQQEPISIDGNSDFINTAHRENWQGNGTSVNPFNIHGIDLDGSTELIKINNTDVYFIISNCVIDGQIIFNNVSNGKLSNNIIEGSYNGFSPDNGISISDSSNLTLSNNIVRNFRGTGIILENSKNNTITSNSVSDNLWDGIWFNSSTSNILMSNTVSFNGNYGFHLENSGNNALIGNTIEFNDRDGIRLMYSGNNTILDNNFRNNLLTIWFVEDLTYSLQAEVRNNYINGRPIIYMKNVNNEIILEDAGQIILINSSFVEITGQLFLYSLTINYCSDLIIRNNIIFGLNRPGIVIFYTHNSILENNRISDNENHGLILAFSSNTKISDNIISNNGYSDGYGNGIFLSGSNNNTISNNIIHDNDQSGIHLFSSDFNQIGGNAIFNNNDGISFVNSRNNQVIDNHINQSRNVGINFDHSSNNNINTNDVYNNGWVGFYIHDSGNNSFSENNLFNNAGGLFLINSSYNVLISNSIFENRGDGINIYNSKNCLFSNNLIANNYNDGIFLLKSENNVIQNNEIIENGQFGVNLRNSGNNIILNNIFEDDGLFIVGDNISHYQQTNIDNNTINTIPIIYLINENDITISENASQIIIGNSFSIKIHNLVFSIREIPIIIFNSYGIDISNNKITNAFTGIESYKNSFINIRNNEIINTWTHGITLKDSSNNEISSNLISNAQINGIYLYESNTNSINNNVIRDSREYGIFLHLSMNNMISWNDFLDSNFCSDEEYISNGIPVRYECSQAFATTINNDISYNYWNDWTKPDDNYDCIVDNAYRWAGDNYIEFDRAPLVKPVAKNSLDGNFCKSRAQISSFLKKNQTVVIFSTILILILIIYQFVRIIKKRKIKLKEAESNLYPDEIINEELI